MTASAFIPARELSRAFYADAVRPVLAGRPHVAALLGYGSDVLGFDTERSTDHGWGPRTHVLLADHSAVAEVWDRLDAELPETFRGWPVRYGWDAVPVTHHVTVTSLPDFLTEHLGVDPREGMSTVDWLVTPQQRVLEVIAGPVHADPDGALAEARHILAWYPDQTWRWLLACQWHRLAQEEAFVSRTAEVGDEPGSAVTAARLVRDMMRLALLMDRRYAPYQKWLGTTFARAPHPDALPVQLADALHATDLPRREAALAGAYGSLALRHNASGLTEPLDPATGNYHDRPAHVLMADRFADALFATVTDPQLAELPAIGSVDQAVDSTDFLGSTQCCRSLAPLYRTAASSSSD